MKHTRTRIRVRSAMLAIMSALLLGLSGCGSYLAQQEAISCQKQFTEQVAIAQCEDSLRQERIARSQSLMYMGGVMMQPKPRPAPGSSPATPLYVSPGW